MILEIELSEQKQRDLRYYWSFVLNKKISKNKKIETIIKDVITHVIARGARISLQNLEKEDY
jgi:hypothetical protein